MRRCKRSIEHQANVFDTRLLSRNYCERLEKYAKRGFAIAAPGLEEASLSQRLLASTYLLIERHGILLSVGETGACSPESSTMAVGKRDMKVQYSRAVRATVVKDLARMIVLSRGTFERLNVPSEQRCGTCQKPCFADATQTKAAVPIVGELPGEYFVLYGCKQAKGQSPSQSSSADDEDEDECYSQARKCAGHLVFACASYSLFARLALLDRIGRWGLARPNAGRQKRCLYRNFMLSSTTISEMSSGCKQSRIVGQKVE